MPDYYAVLGIAPTATEKEVKTAFRTLAKKYHPDLGGDAAKLQAVNEAADVLTDPAKRAAYDAERKGGPTKASTSSAPRQAEPEGPPPRKKTIALCEFCNTVNRVNGDPRWYPANCGKCGRPLGTHPPKTADEAGDPFQRHEELKREAPPTMARCPHCQMRNRVTAPGRPITCGSCGREYMPGTGETDDGFGRVLGDLANSLFGGGADRTARGMRFAEEKLREMADELKRRREDMEKK